MPAEHHVDLRAAAGSRARLEAKQAETPSPTGVSGAVLGGIGAGLVWGPIAAIVGFFIGLIAGEAFERHSRAKHERSEVGDDG